MYSIAQELVRIGTHCYTNSLPQELIAIRTSCHSDSVPQTHFHKTHCQMDLLPQTHCHKLIAKQTHCYMDLHGLALTRTCSHTDSLPHRLIAHKKVPLAQKEPYLWIQHNKTNHFRGLFLLNRGMFFGTDLSLYRLSST